MFSHYQIHLTCINKTASGPSSEDGITTKVSKATHSQSIQHGSSLYFCAKMLHKAQPKTPHCGLISLFLVLLSTLGILGILSVMAYHQFYVHNGSSKGGGISKGSPQGISGASKGDASIFGTSKGDSIISAFEGDIFGAFGFTTSFADVISEQLNTQVHFDTDSVCFVCDNSTTGHICNDIWKFVEGTIRQTNKSLMTANGTGSCLQEGTVKIRLIDDVGTQHIFILDNCLYHPNTPVNLPQDNLQRNSLMQMEIWMKKLALNLDI
jgi:hypothetical protein